MLGVSPSTWVIMSSMASGSKSSSKLSDLSGCRRFSPVTKSPFNVGLSGVRVARPDGFGRWASPPTDAAGVLETALLGGGVFYKLKKGWQTLCRLFLIREISCKRLYIVLFLGVKEYFVFRERSSSSGVFTHNR